MPGWDDLCEDAFWREWALRPPLQITLDWMRAMKQSGASRVHDMGCGLGRHTVQLAQAGFRVTASDISDRAVEATRRVLREMGLEADVVQADMTSLPRPDAQFDGVLSIGVLEHNTRSGMELAIAEIRRVLRPGGQLLASFVPRNRWTPRDEPGAGMLEDNTLRQYGPEQAVHHLVDEEELRELLADFDVLSVNEQSEKGEGWSMLELFVAAVKPERI